MIEMQQGSFFDQYDVYEEIGSGHFAVVRRCVEKSTGKEYAAKIIRKRRTSGSRRGAPLEDIFREIELLKEMNHDNVISLYCVYDTGLEVVLVLELVQGGELFEYISEKDCLSEEETGYFVAQILFGLEHLHSKGIAHLDLKPENVLLVSKECRWIKLIDFGLSRRVTVGGDLHELLGTPEFVAPEIVNFEPVSLATDMWSVGVITYMLLSGASPFLGDTKQETFANVSAVDYCFDEEYFENVSELALDFISNLLVRDPRKRATVQQCLNHPWLQKSAKAVLHFIKFSSSAKSSSTCMSTSRNGTTKFITNAEEKAEKKARPNQDENFVVAALFGAIEEGNLAGLEELFAMSNIDASQSNRHGETAVHIAAGLGQLDILKFLHSKRADIHRLDSHGDSAIYWAARQGHAHIIRYLYEQGVRVDTQNKSQETALHVASRYGHADAVEQLLKCGADVNLADEHGETALHIGVWHGFPKIVHVLCEVGGRTGLRNKEEETPLHCAAARGHIDCVRCLLDAGVELNLVDKNGCTALHLALRRHHIAVAMLLLHAGCQIDVVDNQGETAIHIAAKEGLLLITQTLCSSGCKVDLPNKAGLYPLHLAAKNGHTEVVRCLCLAGSNIEQKNRDGIIAEIAALAQGFSDIGELLNRLRNDQQREEYISQLIPSSQPISRVKLKLFGHSGVGKTTLVDSLKCGYFSSWFRRSKPSSPVPPNNLKKGSHSSRSSIETNSSGPEDQPLSFNNSNANYTRGIDIQQVNISGVGDLSIWEFSGYESYYQVYDHFIGSVNCYHLVLFRLSDPYEVQLQQVMFWLWFLRARIPPIEPLGLYGKSCKPAKVMLIGTHSDVAGCQRNSGTGEYVSPEAQQILQAAQQKFRHVFDIYETVLVMDAHVVGSPAMKTLKQYLSSKTKVLQGGVPNSTGILESMISHLTSWRKSASGFPVLSWQQFVDMFHLQVNPLASDDHLKELIQQLQLMGEILYLKSESQDLVVLNPKWLCTDVIGHLLSQEYLEQTRMTGCYSVDDIQLLFPNTDALDLLQVLEAIHLCTQCDNDGEIEYEFPCFNMVEATEGLWEKNDLRYIRGVYGGVRLQFLDGVCQTFSFLFPRFQVQLRRMAQDRPDPENDLYQWFQGSKICSGALEGLVTLNKQGEALEIKVRAPQDMKSESFYFLENLISAVEQVLSETCPGIPIEKYRLSPFELREHRPFITGYPPTAIMRALFKDGLAAILHNENESIDERFVDVIFFGARNIGSRNLHAAQEGNGGITLAPELQATHLSLLTRQCLCALIDPPEPMGRDWCMLGVRLGMTDKLPKIDPGDNSVLSPTSRVLNEWSKDAGSTIGCLVKKLEELARHEAVEVILKLAPLLKVFPAEEEPVNDDMAAISDSHTSSSNLSR